MSAAVAEPEAKTQAEEKWQAYVLVVVFPGEPASTMRAGKSNEIHVVPLVALNDQHAFDLAHRWMHQELPHFDGPEWHVLRGRYEIKEHL